MEPHLPYLRVGHLPILIVLALSGLTLGAQAPRSDTIVVTSRVPRYPAGGTLGKPVTIIDSIGGSGTTGLQSIFVTDDGVAWATYLQPGPQRKARLRLADSTGTVIRDTVAPGFPVSFDQLKDGRVVARIGLLGLPPRVVDGRAVYDQYSHRIRLFAGDGSLDTTWSYDSEGFAPNYGRNAGIVVDTAGTVLLPFDRSRVYRDRDPDPASFVLRLRPNGTIVDSITHRSLPPFYSALPPATNRPGILHPFGYLISSEQSASIPSRPSYAINLSPLVASGGAPITSIRRTTLPVGGPDTLRTLMNKVGAMQSITVSGEGDLWVRVDRGWERCTVSPPAPPALVGGGGADAVMPPPATASPTTGVRLIITVDGQLQATVNQEGWCARSAYEVFASDGSYLGEVATPKGLWMHELVAFKRNAVWGMTRTPDGRASLVRYTVVWK
jgi:hypothetical protein